MATSTDAFSSRRLDNIKRNKALLEELGATAQAKAIQESVAANGRERNRPAPKRRRVEDAPVKAAPTRTSARIAATPKARYNENEMDQVDSLARAVTRKSKEGAKQRGGHATPTTNGQTAADGGGAPAFGLNLDELRASWSSWTPTAPAPSRDETGVLHFASHPDFMPNKSPAEVLREGAFGGSYFRALYSKKLGTTITDDYRELPASWIEGLDVKRYLTSPTYDPEANKFKVACGQSIEEWEAAGWIDHRFDVRGWFQWYCRFYEGRRCDDDDRQVSRWKKCVGATGRWRRMLLKKYIASGVRTVWDDGEDDDAPEVSPVMHQTCHHWAFEVTQDVLDEYWRTGK